MSDLELQLFKRIIDVLERRQGVSQEDQELRELRDLVMALELTRRMEAQRPARKPVDWGKLLPLLVSLAIVLGVVLATLLGVDLKGVL